MSEQKIIIGNCLDVLRGMPDESVDVCVTSPPYWALRDYGTNPVVWGDSDCEHEWTDHRESARGGVNPNASVGANRDGEGNNRGHPTVTQYCSKCGAWKGQLGLEPSPLEYIDHLMMIFDEVKRVLKPTGACWVNLGDTYATTSGFTGDTKGVQRSLDSIISAKKVREGLSRTQFPQKTLVQIPSRFAIAMADHGWILRNEIIWQKDSAMPSSVKDRFTVDFEKFFFFVKNPKYYFKQQLEEVKQESIARAKRARHNTLETKNVIRGSNAYELQHNDPNWKRWGNPEGRNCRTVWFDNTSKWKDDDMEASVRQGMHQNRGNGVVYKRYNLPDKAAFTSFMKSRITPKEIVYGTEISVTTAEHWFRTDEGFSYPTVEDWMLIRDKVSDDSEEYSEIDKGMTDVTVETDDILKNSDGMRNVRTTWSICNTGSNLEHVAMFPKKLVERPIDACCPEGGIVLDPFCGSGTVLEYCYDHDINGIGIEINPAYEPLIKKRAKHGQTRLTFD